MTNLDKALGLAKLGLHVFPCAPDTKRPITGDGFNSATTDPTKVKGLWGKNDYPVGVWCGPSGLVVLDVDVKTENGKYVKDGWASLEDAWLTPDETFNYPSAGGEGTHYVYTAPADLDANGSSNYRGMKHVDRRAGNSYVVWAGDVPASRDVFSPAPQWLCDPVATRSVAAFEGTVKDWYESLVPGEPGVIVRKAMDRADAKFQSQGNDLSHGDIIELQHEAIRLGAEGHAGVEQLLALLEELTLNREGAHSRDADDWQHEFLEGLTSGIRKHGDSIQLRKELPEYSPALIPDTVLDSLVNGEPGDRNDFNTLLAALARANTPVLDATAVLWGAPKTRDVAKDWGLPFVHKRVLDAQIAPPPVRENPTLPSGAPVKVSAVSRTELLTPEEREIVKAHPTFIDYYVEKSFESKGWVVESFAIQAAWTLLSLAFGYRAFIGIDGGVPVNLWFITLGHSGTGKTVHFNEQKRCMSLLLNRDGETHWNVGALSSPEAMHEVLLERDKKPSIVFHDEASGFFKNLSSRDWMAGIEHQMAEWYSGNVPPVNKVRLKELKGKSAETSFNMSLASTPSHLLQYVSLSMFDSGFLARASWVWGPPPRDDDTQFDVNESEVDDTGANPIWFDVVNDLIAAQQAFNSPRIKVTWVPGARARALEAVKSINAILKTRDKYDSSQYSVPRMKETIWKCAGLLALYRGSRVISEVDMLTAISYAEQWVDDLSLVIDKAGAGEFSNRMDEIEAFIKAEGGATATRLYNRFKQYMKFGVKDVDSVVEALLESGRINKDTTTKIVRYVVNG